MSLKKFLEEAKKRRQEIDDNIAIMEQIAPIREKFEKDLKEAGLSIYSVFPEWTPKNSKVHELRQELIDALNDINATPEKAFPDLQGQAVDHTFDAEPMKKSRKKSGSRPKLNDPNLKSKVGVTYINPHFDADKDKPSHAEFTRKGKTGVDPLWYINHCNTYGERPPVKGAEEAPGVITPENAPEGKKKEETRA